MRNCRKTKSGPLAFKFKASCLKAQLRSKICKMLVEFFFKQTLLDKTNDFVKLKLVFTQFQQR